MKGTLVKAFGYQGDNMNLPVANLATALPFYETVLGFQVVARTGKCSTSSRLTVCVFGSASDSRIEDLAACNRLRRQRS